MCVSLDWLLTADEHGCTAARRTAPGARCTLHAAPCTPLVAKPAAECQ